MKFEPMGNAEKRTLATNLYLKSSLNRKEIATQVGITEKTLRKWIDEDGLEDIKESQMILRPQLLKDAMEQLAAVNKVIREQYSNIPNKQLADAKGVLRKEIEALTHQPIHKYVEVFEELTEWMAKNSPKYLKEVALITQEFLSEIAKRK